MRSFHLALAVVLASRAAGVAPVVVAAADRGHPTVVELFTAQGCAACPPADAALGRLATRPDVLPLSFSVTYWDRFGWRDPLARPEFTERQYAYARTGRREAGTPQFVVNGRFATPYRGDAALARAIDSADRGAAGPAISSREDRVLIGADARSARDAAVWLVEYDPRTIRTPVPVGQNGGRTLAHRNVVCALRRLGGWTGAAASFPLPPARPGLRRAVLVQGTDGGAIIAARAIP